MRVSYVKECVKQITETANYWGISMRSGIEFFCGDGSIYSDLLASRLCLMTGLDVDQEKGRKLKEKIPWFNFIAVNSIEYAKEYQGMPYDIISFDNPLCIYGKYCEHFEILPYAYKFVHKDDKSLIVFDIVHTPYNITSPENCEWIKRRMDYYGITSGNLDLEYAKLFYTKKFVQQGLKVFHINCICREVQDSNDYFYMVVCVVGRS